MTPDPLEPNSAAPMTDEEDYEQEPTGVSGSVKVALVLAALMLIGLGLLLFTDFGNAATYAKGVADVAQSPNDYLGQNLRLEGALTPGSIRRRTEPTCEWRFSIESEGRQLPIRFRECVVPDTFKDGFNITVVVEGQVAKEGHFNASKIIPKCPSKYEMDELQKSGEKAPHTVSEKT